jgi:hypothetical protein
MLTEHAVENIEKYAKMIRRQHMLELLAKMSKAVKMDGSIACVVRIPSIDNPYRDDWKSNDRLVAIVRNHQVKTVMLSRKSQINKSHLRTSRII